MKNIRRGLFACTLAGLVSPALAQSLPREYSLEIVPLPLVAALKEFSRQTGLQVGYLPDGREDEGTIAAPLRGKYTAESALRELLEPSGLSFERINSRTIAVTTPATLRPSDPSTRTSDAASLSTPTFLHLVDRHFVGEAGGAGEFRRIAAVRESERGEEVPEDRGQSKDRAIEEVVVTGSQIRGVENTTAPITVLEKAYIDSTGISTTTGLIESLPQNFALASQSGVVVPGVTGEGGAQGSSINLRGIGEGTTLVLLNGRRMAPGFAGSAVDISALPLSALERVEVLTDGASALYGSDAVGGVVNFILRDDFEGAETRMRTGWGGGGVNEHRLSQVLGNTWGSGSALVSLEYYKRDLLSASARDFVPDTSIIGSLFPRDENYSGMFSGRQSLTAASSMFVNALYTKRDSYNQAGRITFNENNTTQNPQITATMGFDWLVGRDWQIEASGSYAENRLEGVYDSNVLVAFGLGSLLYDSRFEIQAAQIKADGSLFRLPGGTVHVAVGADWRSESFQYLRSYTSGLVGSHADLEQIVRSAFGEVQIPVVGATNAFAGVNRLELSLAGRFDDYSSFGSSFDPRIGMMWEPISGLRFRGSHGTSYRAPKLDDYNAGRNAASAAVAPDPRSSSGVSRQLQVQGTNVGGLSAQESVSSSFGLEFVPVAVPRLQMGLNYYKIDYRHRIATPPLAPVILGNPSSFNDLIIRDPSVAEVNEYIAIGQLGQGFFPFIPNFTPDLVDVIVDGRRRNLSVVKTRGLDASLQYDFSAGEGDIHLGLTGTYIFELVQQITATSDPFDTVDTFYNPPDWRARGSVGWRRQGWAGNLFVNYTDSYTDNRAITLVPVSSYTTVDARLAYDFKEQFHSGFLSGLIISASVQNLFDRDPPRTAVVSVDGDMGFDPTNASPMGRFVAIELLKTW